MSSTDAPTAATQAPAADAPAAGPPPAQPPRSGSDERPQPPRRRRGRGARTWRARLLVVVMLALAVQGTRELIDARNATLARFDLGTVTLTAHAIPVEPRQSGQVTAVDVHAQDRVTAGQRLGMLVATTATPTPTGRTMLDSVPLTAPTDGVVSTDPLPIGSTVQPDQPFVQLYDPARLTFTTTVPVEDLPRLATGMVATLRAPGVARPVRATVLRAVPRIFDASDGNRLPAVQDRLLVILTPEHPADVAQLVPGLRFTGAVDTRTAPAGGSTPLLRATS